jgi:hypothetical protein
MLVRLDDWRYRGGIGTRHIEKATPSPLPELACETAPLLSSTRGASSWWYVRDTFAAPHAPAAFHATIRVSASLQKNARFPCGFYQRVVDGRVDHHRARQRSSAGLPPYNHGANEGYRGGNPDSELGHI